MAEPWDGYLPPPSRAAWAYMNARKGFPPANIAAELTDAMGNLAWPTGFVEFGKDLEACAICTFGLPEVQNQVLACATWGHQFNWNPIPFINNLYTVKLNGKRVSGGVGSPPAPFTGTSTNGPSGTFMQLVNQQASQSGEPPIKNDLKTF